MSRRWPQYFHGIFSLFPRFPSNAKICSSFFQVLVPFTWWITSAKIWRFGEFFFWFRSCSHSSMPCSRRLGLGYWSLVPVHRLSSLNGPLLIPNLLFYLPVRSQSLSFQSGFDQHRYTCLHGHSSLVHILDHHCQTLLRARITIITQTRYLCHRYCLDTIHSQRCSSSTCPLMLSQLQKRRWCHEQNHTLIDSTWTSIS